MRLSDWLFRWTVRKHNRVSLLVRPEEFEPDGIDGPWVSKELICGHAAITLSGALLRSATELHTRCPRCGKELVDTELVIVKVEGGCQGLMKRRRATEAQAA